MTAWKESQPMTWLFQLTSSQGGWQLRLRCRELNFISTHILARRMTFICYCFRYSFFISTHILTRRMTNSASAGPAFAPFQLTSSRGGWHSPVVVTCFSSVFQLTSSRGGWPMTQCNTSPFSLYFNSHPHEEDDTVQFLYVHLCQNISTHILTRRMTTIDENQRGDDKFQLTSSQGGWPFTAFLHPFLLNFNSHPHKEDDLLHLIFL